MISLRRQLITIFTLICIVLGAQLVRKWKGMKDSFMRSVKKKTVSGQGASNSNRRYVYSRQMEILMKCSDAAPTVTSIDDDAQLTEAQDLEQSEQEQVDDDFFPSGQQRHSTTPRQEHLQQRHRKSTNRHRVHQQQVV